MLRSPKDSKRHHSHRDKDRSREKKRKRKSKSPSYKAEGKNVLKDVVRNYDEEEKDCDSSDNDTKLYSKSSRSKISSSQDWSPDR